MKILTTPNPFLRHTAKSVKSLDNKTVKEVHSMIDILKHTDNPKGVGLAATQVGLDKRIFILLNKKTPQIFVNPTIQKQSKTVFSETFKQEKDRWLEGCLSIPSIWGFVDRPFAVTLEFQSPKNFPKGDFTLVPQKKIFEDIESAYVQHETDHLNGILFTDHILKQGGTILKETSAGLEPISI